MVGRSRANTWSVQVQLNEGKSDLEKSLWVGALSGALLTIASQIYYNFGLGHGFHISPDFQLVQPGDGRRDWTAIPGFRVLVDF